AMVTINEPTATTIAVFTADTTSICEGSSVTFFNTSSNNAIGYSWNLPGGTTGDTTAQNPVVWYNTEGNYDVTLTAFGCDGTDSTYTWANYITVNPAPAANLTANSATTFCTGDSVELVQDTAGISNYDWLLDGISTGAPGWSYQALIGGNYQVVVWNIFGCNDTSAAITVTVNSLPVISVTPGSVCGSGDSVTLTASGAVTYTWSPAATLSADTGAVVSAFPIVNAIYTVVGTGVNNCVDSTTVLVQIDTSLCPVGVSELFDPDNSIKIYPNPFENNAVITYELNAKQYVNIKIIDLLGKVTTIVPPQFQQKGHYQYSFNHFINNPAPGIYFMQIAIGEKVVTKKVVCSK
ncbi:MAG: T9SS type A sorting domain-containing protein, partial [Bacteroidetes bacterium]|nr:T9SS type A sorting domain-containing protein [Bacteroidota bacterium]